MFANGKIKLMQIVANNTIYAKLATGMQTKFATIATNVMFLNADIKTPQVPTCTANIVAIVFAILGLNTLLNNFVSGLASKIIESTAI